MVELVGACVVLDDAFGRGVRVRRGRLVVVLTLESAPSSLEMLLAVGGFRVLLVLRVLLVVPTVVVVGATVVLTDAGPTSMKSPSNSSSLSYSSSSIVSDTGITGISDGCVGRVRRVRRVRRGREVDVVLVDKFIISTVIFPRIKSCIALDGLLVDVGRVRLVRRGRIVVVLVKSSAFHISYALVSVSSSSYSTLSCVSSANLTSSLGVFARDLLIRRISLEQEIVHNFIVTSRYHTLFAIQTHPTDPIVRVFAIEFQISRC